MNSSDILLPGEVAIAAIPNRNTIISSDSTPEHTPPAVGIKVGDGLSYFYELPWLQGIAADVYNWAKTETKPTYTANEISGLADYIATHGGGGGGGSAAGASSAYRIAYDSSSSKYILQYYDEDNEEWKASTGDEINLSTILSRINTIERWANGAKTQLGNIELPITGIVYDEVVTYLNRLDVIDNAVAHQFVTSVSQVDGRIKVTRSILSASDITSGVFNTSQGGTGLSRVEEGELLVGSNAGNITTKTFVTEIDPTDRASLVTAGAIIDYVSQMTAGLTGAMHFVGEATVIIDTNVNNHVDPQIADYDFRKAQPGDVILANNAQEYVWTGTEWRLLGDEGSYAIKGSIRNADIADNAAISQDKIDGLAEALSNKVSVVEGKGLSTNDYTAEDKEKLSDIEENAQENVIEHVFVNDTEITPSTISNNPKSIGINFTPYTPEEQEKLAGIQAEAQVNAVETITINGTEYIPDTNKNIDIKIDQAALDLDVLTGARVPGTTSGSYEDVDVTATTKQLELARIAKTGLISDAKQISGTYFIINCGSSTEVV